MNNRPTILLIDDNDLTNYINKLIIDKFNHPIDTLTANSGAGALALLQDYNREHQKFPELVILDFQMPEMDGIRFIREFNRIKPANDPVHIVVLSGLSNAEYYRQAQEEGVSEIIRKPFTTEKLQHFYDKYFSCTSPGGDQGRS